MKTKEFEIIGIQSVINLHISIPLIDLMKNSIREFSYTSLRKYVRRFIACE